MRFVSETVKAIVGLRHRFRPTYALRTRATRPIPFGFWLKVKVDAEKPRVARGFGF
jgi:hypothetical protein